MELEEGQLTSNSLHRMLLSFNEQTKGQNFPENALDHEMLEIVMGSKELLKACTYREILLMKRNFLFYPPWAYAVPSWIIKIPVSFLEAGVWTILTYYVIGFDPNVSRFFDQYLIVLLVNQMSSGLFRFIGAMGRNMIVANTFGSFALLLVFALGGFVLSRDDVKSWWLWGYWSSPMMYAMNGTVVNEFLGHSWRTPLNGTTLGKQVITSRGFFVEAYWYWIAVVALLGFILVFNICFALSLAFLNHELSVFLILESCYRLSFYYICFLVLQLLKNLKPMYQQRMKAIQLLNYHP